MQSKELSSRFVGAIVGFAVGDALGMPAEFLTPSQIRRYYGKPIADFQKAHPGHASDSLQAGAYTDDTQMVIATAECLIECQAFNPARQAEALLSWYLNTVPHRTPMRANMRACKHLSTGKAWTKSGVFSSGCGAAVRMPPIGLFFCQRTDDLSAAALNACVITHNEPRAKAGSLAVAQLIARLAAGKSDASTAVTETADCIATVDANLAEMLRWVIQIVHLPPEEALFEIGTSTDALEAVPAAVYCFMKYPTHFAKAVLAAVNAGDAADSIGALTGSFVGAHRGFDAIPRSWRENVEDSDFLIKIAERLAAVVGSIGQSSQIRKFAQ